MNTEPCANCGDTGDHDAKHCFRHLRAQLAAANERADLMHKRMVEEGLRADGAKEWADRCLQTSADIGRQAAELRERAETAERERDRLARCLKCCPDGPDCNDLHRNLTRERDALRAELAEAYERAARLVEEIGRFKRSEEIAAAIRQQLAPHR